MAHVTPSSLRCRDTGTDGAAHQMPTVLTAVASVKSTSRLADVSVSMPVTCCRERKLVFSRSTVPVYVVIVGVPSYSG